MIPVTHIPNTNYGINAAVQALFSGGAKGVWYDPSNYSTLFQDSAGTTPVTAVEQPVGLMLDKSQGLVLGSEIITPEANRDFSSDTGYWAKDTGVAIGSGVCTFTSALNTYALYKNSILTAGVYYEVTFTIASISTGGLKVFVYGASSSTYSTPGTYTVRLLALGTVANSFQIYAVGTATTAVIDNVSLKQVAGNHAFQSTSASRPVLSARVNKLLATATLATQSVTTRATAHTLRFEGAGTVTLTGTAIGVYTAGTHSITTTAGTLTLTVLGSVTSADLRETNDGVGLPVYQAVVTSTNYATTGFLPYLKFDGVDDSLSTNSINFTSTDKMSVFAGVRKLSDAAYGTIVESSVNNDSSNGSFAIFAPNLARWDIRLKGTGSYGTYNPETYTAPVASVIALLGNLAGSTLSDKLIPRVNGVIEQENATAGTIGGGNMGNYPLYIGRRGGSSLPFNGQMYSMIIVGKAVTATELSSTETYTAIKTGVTLA